MASALHQLKIFIFWRAIVANSRLTGFIGFLLLASCAFVIPSNLRAQGEGSLLVMPVPAHVVQREGEFLIAGPFGIALEGYKEARLERAQQRFLDTLSRETGMPLWRAAVLNPPHFTVPTAAPRAAAQHAADEASHD